MTHREIVLSTRSFGTQWGKIHTTFLLSGGMRHTYIIKFKLKKEEIPGVVYHVVA